MSFVAVKEEILDIVARIGEDWKDYDLKIEKDNRQTIDQATQVNPYLQVQVIDLSGEQMELGAANQVTKQYGQIALCAVLKEGAGDLDGDRLLDFVVRYFHLARLNTFETAAAERHKAKTVNGWYHMPLVINFWYYWK